MKTIYFAHPKHTYNTYEEKHIFSTIEKFFPKDKIVCPNKHLDLGEDMQSYLKWVREKADVVVAWVCKRNGSTARGAWMEAVEAFSWNKPVYTVWLIEASYTTEIKRAKDAWLNDPTDWKYQYGSIGDRNSHVAMMLEHLLLEIKEYTP